MTGLSIWLWPMCLVLASGVLLFLFLPRSFSGSYGPGPTLRETVVHPGAKSQFAWGDGRLPSRGHDRSRGVGPPPVGHPSGTLRRKPGVRITGPGLGGRDQRLLWGIASDFLPVPRLLITLAVLLLPAAGWGWLLDDPAGGALFLSLVGGGLISLPWVLMAEVLPMRHFGKLALAVTLVGSLGGVLALVYWGSALDRWRVDSFLWIILAEVGLLVTVVAVRPMPIRVLS